MYLAFSMLMALSSSAAGRAAADHHFILEDPFGKAPSSPESPTVGSAAPRYGMGPRGHAEAVRCAQLVKTQISPMGFYLKISAPRTSDVMGCLCRMHAWAPPGHTLVRMNVGTRACMHHPPPLQSYQATTKTLELYGVCVQKQQRRGSRRLLRKWGGQCTRLQVRLAVRIALCGILHCSPHF